MTNKSQSWYSKLLDRKVLLSIITFIGILGILFYLIKLLITSVKGGTPFPEEYSAPILAILGVVISIIVLAFVSIVFSFINQSDNKHALGLPQGSVRALIALCLVTSFIIIAVVLFNKLSNPSEPRKLNGLTPAQFAQIESRDLLSSDVRTVVSGKDILMLYDVSLIGTLSTDANDFAKQLLTILSTLAIAVSAFYFGSKATEMGGQQAVSILTESRRDKPKADQMGEVEPSQLATAQSWESLTAEDRKIKIKEVIALNLNKWKHDYPNFITSLPGKKVVGTNKTKTDIDCIVVEVTHKDPTLDPKDIFPKFIEYAGFTIPTDVQVVKIAKTQGYITPDPKKAMMGMENDPRRPGSGISRILSNEYGTLGLKVFREVNSEIEGYYLLSCYHVLCYKELIDKRFTLPDNKIIRNPEVVCPCKRDDGQTQLNIKGDVKEGFFNQVMDAAIAKLRNKSDVAEKIHEINGPTGIYDVDDRDENRLEVVTWGRVSGLQTGLVIKNDLPFPLEYIRGKPEMMFHGLIRVSKVSVGGDSGAPVLTRKDNKVIGMLIGGDGEEFSYIIPIRRIMNTLGVQVCTI